MASNMGGASAAEPAVQKKASPDTIIIESMFANPEAIAIKLDTLVSLVNDTLYDYIVYNVQGNSSSQAYRTELNAFLSAAKDEFITKTPRDAI